MERPAAPSCELSTNRGNFIGMALRRRFLTLVVTAMMLVGGMGIIRLSGMEVLPKQDSGAFTVSLETEPGSSLERTKGVVRQVEQLIGREPEVVTLKVVGGTGFEPVTP